jgi:hypothetical protein
MTQEENNYLQIDDEQAIYSMILDTLVIEGCKNGKGLAIGNTHINIKMITSSGQNTGGTDKIRENLLSSGQRSDKQLKEETKRE